MNTGGGWVALAVLVAGCSDKPPASVTASSGTRTADAKPVAALSYWTGAQPGDIAKYPVPTAVATVARSSDIPRLLIARPATGAKPVGSARNLAVEIEVLATGTQPRIFGSQAPEGSSFVVVDTKWRNVHAKQRMDKASSEGKADRTMGVGSFGGGRTAGTAADSVDVDVAYQVPRLADHVYLVADGLATALHSVTEEIPGGTKIGVAFTVAKLGETRDARFAFVAPTGAKNVAIQFFDYKYGHVLVPIRGDAKSAAGDGTPPGKVLDKAQTTKLDVAAHSLAFRADYAGAAAPQGWRYAVVQLGGRSRSVRNNVGDIVQIDPTKFIWLEGDGGYVYPSAGGSTTSQRVLRFTPEIYQMQEVAFLVPAAADRFRLGLRAETEVARLAVTDKKPGGLPQAKESHKDGNTMEVLLLSSRQDGEHLVLD
ncbi:MAG TPA: hypothetical protein VJB15_12190, partial [Rhodothermia bacterium]|nr:hypothetical protein [Rhodothermia bacterium]